MMTQGVKEETNLRPWYIRDTAFSKRLNPHDKAVFMRICPMKKYRKGESIFFAGDPATDLHIIASGQIKLVAQAASGSERILAICSLDDFIGEAFLLGADYYQVDAIALTDAVTCPVSREQFLQLALNAPSFVLSFAEIVASHLFYCRQQLSDAYDPVKVRLAKSLLDLVGRFGKALDEDGWYELQVELTHDDMASVVSATRVSVTMALTELRDEGLVEGSRGCYRINAPALASFVEPDI